MKLLMIAWGITELVKEMVTMLITAMVSLLMTVLVTEMTKEMITMTRSPRYHGRVNDCSKWPPASSYPNPASCFRSSSSKNAFEVFFSSRHRCHLESWW